MAQALSRELKDLSILSSGSNAPSAVVLPNLRKAGLAAGAKRFHRVSEVPAEPAG